jgi:hypothetical protein
MSDPMAPWVPENAPNLMQDFNAAARDHSHEQAQSESAPSAPQVPQQERDLTQTFNAAAHGHDHKGRSQSDAKSLTKGKRDKPEVHLRPPNPKLVNDVHKTVDLEAQRRAFMKSHRIEPDDFGPKL